MPYVTEQLKVSKHGVKARINVLSGKEGEFYVSISPSLNVSGYGSTKKEAHESFKHNLDLFAESLLKLKLSQLKAELKKLGWEPKKYARKQYSKAFVDADGVLQNLEGAKVTPLETAA